MHKSWTMQDFKEVWWALVTDRALNLHCIYITSWILPHHATSLQRYLWLITARAGMEIEKGTNRHCLWQLAS